MSQTYAEILSSENPDLDVYVGGWIADYPDPDTFMYGVLHTAAGAWGKLAGVPELDPMLERIRSEVDPAARAAVCRDVEAFVAEHCLLVPLASK